MQARSVTRLLCNPLFIILVISLSLFYVMRVSVPKSPSAQAWIEKQQHKLQSTGIDAVQGALKSNPLSPSNHIYSKQHPVAVLHREASGLFKEMVARQSKTLKGAVLEYQRRYGRSPPPGFDKWFEYAKKHNSVIIDEFDTIVEDLEPFWNIEPSRIRTMIDEVARREDIRVWNMSTYHGAFDVPKDNWMGNRVSEMLADIAADLPDMELIMNPLDEPRIILNNDPRAAEGAVSFTEQNQVPGWEVQTKPCESHKPSKKSLRNPLINSHGLSFVGNIHHAMDICQNPAYEHLHGFFAAPPTLIYTHKPLPMFSQAKPSTFSDILYPSSWYWDHTDHDIAKRDLDWESKRNNLYWAGSTTGSYARKDYDTKALGHRQRFVALAKQLVRGGRGEAQATFLTESKPGVWKPYSSREILSQLYDVKFTKVVQCDEPACTKEKAYFGVGEKLDDSAQAYRSRFVMDLDGNSFSGRFYNLLASRSAVLKQTIFKEWHDERLVPWFHYIPVSVGMDELPEVMRYLALT